MVLKTVCHRCGEVVLPQLPLLGHEDCTYPDLSGGSILKYDLYGENWE